PGVELLLVPVTRADIDLALGTLEAGGEPKLFLAAIAALPGDADKLVREVVGEPLARPRHVPCTGHPGLLGELPASAGFRFLVGVEAALRHLPPGADPLGRVDPIRPPAD